MLHQISILLRFSSCLHYEINVPPDFHDIQDILINFSIFMMSYNRNWEFPFINFLFEIRIFSHFRFCCYFCFVFSIIILSFFFLSTMFILTLCKIFSFFLYAHLFLCKFDQINRFYFLYSYFSWAKPLRCHDEKTLYIITTETILYRKHIIIRSGIISFNKSQEQITQVMSKANICNWA